MVQGRKRSLKRYRIEQRGRWNFDLVTAVLEDCNSKCGRPTPQSRRSRSSDLAFAHRSPLVQVHKNPRRASRFLRTPDGNDLQLPVTFALTDWTWETDGVSRLRIGGYCTD